MAKIIRRVRGWIQRNQIARNVNIGLLAQFLSGMETLS